MTSLALLLQQAKRRNPQKKEQRPAPGLTPLEKTKIAQECREFCNAPFGKGLPGCETLEYDLEDYNREVMELKENQPKEQGIPGKCHLCSSRKYKRCGISDSLLTEPGFTPACIRRKDGRIEIIVTGARA